MSNARVDGLKLVLVTLFVAGTSTCGGHAPPPAPPTPAAVTRPAPTPRSPPLCSLTTDLGSDRGPRERVFPPGYWLALLVRGYQGSGEIARPPRDCQGAITRFEQDGCYSDTQPQLLPGRLLSVDDVVVVNLDEDRRLVWAMTDRLSDGEAEGPVAVAEVRAHGIDVRALGVLRAYPKNLSLRLERIGQSSVLVADGEHCEAGQIQEDCARAVRLVPLIGDHFIPKPLVDAAGVCLGRPFIPVRGEGTAPDHRRTRYRVETLVTFGADSIIIREQLAIDAAPRRAEIRGDFRGESRSDGASDSRSDNARGSYVTRVQADRQVSIRGNDLVATGPSLLTRWLSEQAGNR